MVGDKYKVYKWAGGGTISLQGFWQVNNYLLFFQIASPGHPLLDCKPQIGKDFFIYGLMHLFMVYLT